MKVLLADDDDDLVDLMTYALRREGYNVLHAIDGQQALARWEKDQPDLILLDGNMPHVDGFEVCRRLRHMSKVPIIMLTARDTEEDVVRGLDVGADDYIVKPFSTKQLAARLRAVLRRAGAQSGDAPTRFLHAGEITLDLDSHQVKVAGQDVQLTVLEFRILYILMLNQPRILPYSRLVEYAWGYRGEASASLLKTHVCHLREKLGIRAGKPTAIRAVLGVGYRLEAANPSARAAGRHLAESPPAGASTADLATAA